MSIANAHVSLLYPLSLFYKADGLVLPRRAKIDGDDMPQPYRQLLVHDGDMTPTLETYFEGEMVLRPLHVEHDNGTYRRSVLLVRKADGFVAEFGAIQIDLDALPDEAAKRVVEASRPLGGIRRARRGAPQSSVGLLSAGAGRGDSRCAAGDRAGAALWSAKHHHRRRRGYDCRGSGDPAHIR